MKIRDTKQSFEIIKKIISFFKSYYGDIITNCLYMQSYDTKELYDRMNIYCKVVEDEDPITFELFIIGESKYRVYVTKLEKTKYANVPIRIELISNEFSSSLTLVNDSNSVTLVTHKLTTKTPSDNILNIINILSDRHIRMTLLEAHVNKANTAEQLIEYYEGYTYQLSPNLDKDVIEYSIIKSIDEYANKIYEDKLSALKKGESTND